MKWFFFILFLAGLLETICACLVYFCVIEILGGFDVVVVVFFAVFVSPATFQKLISFLKCEIVMKTI